MTREALDASPLRTVVTGCAGFIGSTLVDALLAAGGQVWGVDSYSDYYSSEIKRLNIERARRHASFTHIDADICNMEMDRLPGDVNGIFHLAAQPGVRGSWGQSFDIYTRDNILATQRIFDFAAASDVRVVYASSSSVYGDAETYPTNESLRPQPISPYGVTKATCESLAYAYSRNVGLDAVGMRFFTVYGPRQRPDMAIYRLIEAGLTQKPFPLFGDGSQSRDVTYVRDVTTACIAAMHSGVSGTIYNVGGGTEISLRGIVSACENLLSRPIQLDVQPSARGDVKRTAADTGRITADTGWHPTWDLTRGLTKQVEYQIAQTRIC